jgi:hypothetical protein
LAGASFAAGLLASFLIIDASIATALADKVGVAAAVKPEATSQQRGGATTTLNIGKSVFYNERIDTSSSGQVQVLLLDGSTFTVGPNSSLVIDKFVYNPKTGTGTLAASFSKGALRFVGGKLSKNEPGVRVNTPAGALTVRGGVFQGIVDGPNRALFAFVYGKHLSLRRGGKVSVLRVASTVFAINGPGPAMTRDMVQGDADVILAALSGKRTKFAAGKGIKGKPWPYYYGISPTGAYPDYPDIRQLYYDGATTQILLQGAKPVPMHDPVRRPIIPPQIPDGPCNSITHC